MAVCTISSYTSLANAENEVFEERIQVRNDVFEKFKNIQQKSRHDANGLLEHFLQNYSSLVLGTASIRVKAELADRFKMIQRLTHLDTNSLLEQFIQLFSSDVQMPGMNGVKVKTEPVEVPEESSTFVSSSQQDSSSMTLPRPVAPKLISEDHPTLDMMVQCVDENFEEDQQIGEDVVPPTVAEKGDCLNSNSSSDTKVVKIETAELGPAVFLQQCSNSGHVVLDTPEFKIKTNLTSDDMDDNANSPGSDDNTATLVNDRAALSNLYVDTAHRQSGGLQNTGNAPSTTVVIPVKVHKVVKTGDNGSEHPMEKDEVSDSSKPQQPPRKKLKSTAGTASSPKPVVKQKADNEAIRPPKRTFSKGKNQNSFDWYKADSEGKWHCAVCRAAGLDSAYARGHELPAKTTNHTRHSIFNQFDQPSYYPVEAETFQSWTDQHADSDLDEELSLDAIYTIKKPKSTISNQSWAVNTFNEWQRKYGLSIDFTTVTPTELAAYLRTFYAEVKTKSGNMMAPSTLRGLRAGLHRTLTSSPYMRDFNVFCDPEFTPANEMLESVCRIYANSNQSKIKHYPVIEKDDMMLLSEYLKDYELSPENLLHSFWFLLSYKFAKGGREGWRNMTKDTFSINTDETGREYLSVNTPERNQNLQWGNSAKASWDYSDVRAYGTVYNGSNKGNGNLDLVSVYKVFISRLSPMSTALFQTPKKKKLESGCWFNPSPIGINKMGEIMKCISEKACLSQTYTNQSVRASAISVLYRGGVDISAICKMTKHKTEWSLKQYIADQISDKKRKCSEILQAGLTGTKPALENRENNVSLQPKTL